MAVHTVDLLLCNKVVILQTAALLNPKVLLDVGPEYAVWDGMKWLKTSHVAVFRSIT